MQHAYGVGTLPPGWSMAIDASGRTYYQNDFTHETQWEPPGALQAQMVPQGSSLQPEYIFCGVKVSQASLCVLICIPALSLLLPAKANLCKHLRQPQTTCTCCLLILWSEQATHFRLCIILLVLNVGVILRNAPPSQCEPDECDEWSTV